MAEDLIRYDILAQDALRGVVRKVLSEVARTGLPGEHHFFISFATKAPGVRISSRLLDQYPEEMTIVLQHQYWDLAVTDTAFEVGLSFNNVPERLLVPFAAIKGFADPSVQFGLQFELAPKSAAADAAAAEAPATETVAPPEAETPKPAPLPSEAPATPLPAPAATAAQTSDESGGDEAEEERTAAEVVSLDAFRKK
jgi:hypothetical protein